MRTIKRIDRRFPDFKVAIFHSDLERTLGTKHTEFIKFINKKGITWDTSPPYIHQQNGGSERSGQLIMALSRRLRISANLPKQIWPESSRCAADLANLTPVKSLGWKTPLGVLYEHLGLETPSAAFLYAYGSKAYVRDVNIAKGDKMENRTYIGYLVGYDSSNIFRIWVPHRKRVIRARDVNFDETKRYNPDEVSMPLDVGVRQRIDQIIPVIEITEVIEQVDAIADTFRAPNTIHAEDTPKQEKDVDKFASREPQGIQQLLTPDPTPTPVSSSPMPVSAPTEDIPSLPDLPEDSLHGELQNISPEAQLLQGFMDAINTVNPPAITPAPLVAARGGGTTTVSADVNVDHIISGPRIRKPLNRSAFAAHLDGGQGEMSAAFNALQKAYNPQREHQNQLPLPPKNWKELMKHPKKAEFLAATKKEWEAVKVKGTFERVPRPANTNVLPLKWVFVYKFDDNGYLLKCKARICVRGDLQALNHLLDTRATTLAARIFRALMALTAAFDLDTCHLDSVNAFLNSLLDETVYCEFPEGFEEPGHCMLLLRALYGLRRAPKLWQDELSNTLKELGLQPIPEEPCVFTNGRVIVFFFVDDIVLLARKNDRKEMEDLKQKLMARYEMRDLGDVSWFLNIRITRDRDQRKLWLCQDAYVDKIVEIYKPPNKPIYTPLSKTNRSEYTKNEEHTSPSEINAYQRRIGHLIHPSVMARPDVAFSTGLLATFMTNPLQFHRKEADHSVGYLRDTKYFAIEYSARGPSEVSTKPFEIASDAAYGDNPETRRSSEGYVIKLFGGAIDWKSARQAMVTTSTTEAELVSLSHVATQLIWWNRFFAQLGFKPGHKPEIFCDNTQTVGLMNKESPKLKTNLRHVDIRQHWLREQAQSGNIKVTWIPTNEMPADGFTKPLARTRHEEFMRHLGLRDLTTILDPSEWLNVDI